MILGASTRAAAFSACRAGFEPVTADRFADRDLRDCCDASLVTDYPRGLAQFAAKRPELPWMYTGALENQPALVDAISRGRPLWGNPGPVLRAVRCPWRVADAWRDAGLHVPLLAETATNVPADGRWLSKPLASCGGIGIHTLDRPAAAMDERVTGPHRYFQRRIDGQVCGAVFVAAQGRSRLLGVTRQLVGAAWTGATGFQYAGSMGPLRLRDACADQFRRAGDCLAERFQLRGLFGVDAVVSDRIVWPVEVNPRYTASVEVLERALGINTIGLHVDACCRDRLPPTLPAERGSHNWYGKAIVYATGHLTATDRLTRSAVAANDDRWPRYADIPEPGTEIRAGHPILTVFADGDSEERVGHQLRERAATVRRWCL